MIAFVVLAVGTVGIGQLQSQLRLGADVARQRAEALRIGRADLESLRAPGPLADADSLLPAGRDGTRFRLLRRLDAAGIEGANAATVRVRWTDRAGAAREVGLDAILAANDGGFAGALGLGAGAVPMAVRGAFGRSPLVPVEARDLGDGRSAWKPLSGGTVVFVFDNAGAGIVARCSAAASVPSRELVAAGLGGCSSERSVLVSGTLRFASALPPSAAISLALAGGRDPGTATCQSEARKTVRFESAGSLRVETVAVDATPASVGAAAWREEGERFVAWSCAVPPRADGRWSGRAELGGAGAAQLCRIGAGAGTRWVDEIGARPGQNFLVAADHERCDVALAAWAQAGLRP